MDSNNKIFGMLGLCMRAGKLKSGEFSCMEAIRKKTAKVVILSCDASDNTKKQFSNKCSYYKIPIYYYGTMDELGHAIGKDVRTSLAVTDFGLAEALIKNLLSEKSTEEM